MNKIKCIASTLVFSVTLGVMSSICFLKPETAFSEAERRELSKAAELSAETISSGEYMQTFEEASADQFPFREKLRAVKAAFETLVLKKSDNNGIYTAAGHISKIEYPINYSMLDYSADKFRFIYDSYLKDTGSNIYLSIVPDKNYYMAEDAGYLCLDHEKIVDYFTKKADYMSYIDVTPYLSLDDFYKTDSHWRQECITDVATCLASAMGVNAAAQFNVNTLDIPFYGVYAGQYALPCEPDVIKYLTNDATAASTVTYYDTGMPKAGDMYNMEKAHGKDPYEMFMSGTSAISTIENPYANSDKELILFRDSYGGSIAPLLSQAYKKVTVVDIRYVDSKFLGSFIDFTGQDVLFLYSSVLLNNSTALR